MLSSVAQLPITQGGWNRCVRSAAEHLQPFDTQKLSRDDLERRQRHMQMQPAVHDVNAMPHGVPSVASRYSALRQRRLCPVHGRPPTALAEPVPLRCVACHILMQHAILVAVGLLEASQKLHPLAGPQLLRHPDIRTLPLQCRDLTPLAPQPPPPLSSVGSRSTIDCESPHRQARSSTLRVTTHAPRARSHEALSTHDARLYTSCVASVAAPPLPRSHIA